MRRMSDAVHRLQLLRRFRGRPDIDVSIREMVAAAGADAKRTQERLGELIAIWEELVPAGLVERTRIAGLRAGVLRVEVDTSATAFELDRRLRGGLEHELRRRHRATLNRVRVTVGTIEGTAGRAGGPAARPERGRGGGQVRPPACR